MHSYIKIHEALRKKMLVKNSLIEREKNVSYI